MDGLQVLQIDAFLALLLAGRRRTTQPQVEGLVQTDVEQAAREAG
jgi:hypothetical protein